MVELKPGMVMRFFYPPAKAGGNSAGGNSAGGNSAGGNSIGGNS